NPVGPVVAQHPSDEQSQQEEPPTESQDSLPGQEREDEGASVVQVPDLEVDRQELTQPKTGGEHRDGPEVKRKLLPNLELITMPEAGER
ncbi:X antigen family member 3-like, partial [Eschrichtius robustus]|uniref:X antigen family member 3-like n=1 Tax=Eschrichtius robustus TaxID=9764 RepID=UPI0035C1DC7A